MLPVRVLRRSLGYTLRVTSSGGPAGDGTAYDLDVSAEHALARYAEGFFPYFDRKIERYYWDRDVDRAVILLGEDARRVAARERRRLTQFTLRADHDLEGVLALISDPLVRSDTWAVGKVLDVYRRLHVAGYVHTFEAYADEHLVGGLIGVRLGRLFAAETMASRRPGASAACLYRLVEDHRVLQLDLLDVQVRHKAGSPCRKLGEIVLPLAQYLELVRLCRSSADPSTIASQFEATIASAKEHA